MARLNRRVHQRGPGWLAIGTPLCVNVVPLEDLVAHTEDEECACGPVTEPVHRPNGSVGWVLVHHSLDGRERREPRLP